MLSGYLNTISTPYESSAMLNSFSLIMVAITFTYEYNIYITTLGACYEQHF